MNLHDLIEPLRKDPELLNRRNRPGESSEPFYDLMSGAIIWSDEVDPSWPMDIIWALRPVFAYRTSCFVGEERREFRSIWDEARQLFPEWIGFADGRVNPGPELVEFYWQQRRESAGAVDKLEKLLGGNDD